MGMPKMSHAAYDVAPLAPPLASSPIPFETWWPWYSKALYIIASKYDASDKQNQAALQTFINTLTPLFPHPEYRQYAQDFIVMKPYVLDVLLSSTPHIFRAYPWLENVLRTNVKQFHQMAINNQDNEGLFLWIYLLHSFLVGIVNRKFAQQTYAQQQSNPYSVSMMSTPYKMYMPSVAELKENYDPRKMTISDWGQAVWYILHTTALHAPQPLEQSFQLYKQMVYSLRYLLPCARCKQHLTQNVNYIDFDTCPRNHHELFKCSWRLHNIVNQATGKPIMPLEQALSFYV